MAIGIYFELRGVSAEDYRAVHDALESAGHGDPEGRTFHAGYNTADGIQVFDVWESEDAFRAFGGHLMPVLIERGIDPGEPRIGEIERIVSPARI